MHAFDVLRRIWTHPANRHGRLRALGRAAGWQAYKRIVGRPRDIVVFGGLRMRCYPNSLGGSSMVYMNALPDYDDMLLTQRYLRPGDAFVDVGANIGIYTLLAASRVGPHGHVLSFEPGTDAFAMLEQNVALNALIQVEANQLAVANGSDVPFLQGLDTVNRIAVSDLDEEAALVASTTWTKRSAAERSPRGRSTSKGAEPLAFESGELSLAAGNPPVWLIEIKDRLLARYGFTSAGFAATLADFGYLLGRYDADAGRLAVPSDDWRHRENVVAVHRASLDRVVARLAASAP